MEKNNSHHIVNVLGDLHRTIINSNVINSGDPYGEVTQQCIDNIVKGFPDYFTKKTVFYDLGSGIGKMVIHLGLKYNLKKVCGIELNKDRFNLSLELKDKFAKDKDSVSFIKGDILNQNLSDATFIHIDNTLYSDGFEDVLYELMPSKCFVLFRKETFGNIKEKITTVNNGKYSSSYGSCSLSHFIKN